MKDKFEILEEVGDSYCSSETLQAMDEYSQQQAIGFADWITQNKWDRMRFTDVNNAPKWHRVISFDTERKTTEELYSLYLLSLK